MASEAVARFTAENTEGYSAEQLSLLNETWNRCCSDLEPGSVDWELAGANVLHSYNALGGVLLRQERDQWVATATDPVMLDSLELGRNDWPTAEEVSNFLGVDLQRVDWDSKSARYVPAVYFEDKSALQGCLRFDTPDGEILAEADGEFANVKVREGDCFVHKCKVAPEEFNPRAVWRAAKGLL